MWPEEQLRYNGHYPHGDEIIISYSVQGRAVLESPKLERIGENPVIHHRLTVHAGENPLELIVLDDQPEIKGKTATIGYSIAWLQAKHDGVKFRASENGKLVLHIPASSKTLHLNVALSHDESDALKQQTPSHQVVNLLDHTRGGPKMENHHTLKDEYHLQFSGLCHGQHYCPLKNIQFLDAHLVPRLFPGRAPRRGHLTRRCLDRKRHQ